MKNFYSTLNDRSIKYYEKDCSKNWRVVLRNIGLVLRIVTKDYRWLSNNSSIDFDDLIQEGLLGSLKASERFDPNKGFAFSTYAYFWIKQHINRYISNNSTSSCRIPVYLREKINEIKKKYKINSAEEFSELFDKGLIKENIYRGFLIIESNVRLDDDKYGDNETTSLKDLLKSEKDVVKDVDDSLKVDLINMFSKNLTDRQKTIIYKRYGINDIPKMTLDELAKEVGVTRERVRQIEVSSLDKMKETLRSSWCKDKVLSSI